jgi:hypothetical protein
MDTLSFFELPDPHAIGLAGNVLHFPPVPADKRRLFDVSE